MSGKFDDREKAFDRLDQVLTSLFQRCHGSNIQHFGTKDFLREFDAVDRAYMDTIQFMEAGEKVRMKHLLTTLLINASVKMRDLTTEYRMIRRLVEEVRAHPGGKLVAITVHDIDSASIEQLREWKNMIADWTEEQLAEKR